MPTNLDPKRSLSQLKKNCTIFDSPLVIFVSLGWRCNTSHYDQSSQSSSRFGIFKLITSLITGRLNFK